jgi:hypothetical protein
MASKESSNKTGYIVDVKILDVEKRYNTGPKHYVCLRRRSDDRMIIDL